ncbi:hypothetical protein SDC9_119458 [bioreactor metagenome]|uniref:Uncharacterized protein n=1 Tax=bioreactor metagenome TaxID=1076179 RepID=A0A645C4B1_9ZZZZ
MRQRKSDPNGRQPPNGVTKQLVLAVRVGDVGGQVRICHRKMGKHAAPLQAGQRGCLAHLRKGGVHVVANRKPNAAHAGIQFDVHIDRHVCRQRRL